MLTIGKLGSSRGQLQYYEQQVAAGIEDYYAGRGEAPGRWLGSGTDALGLTPGQNVEREAFMALMQGRSPVDGTVVRPMGACSTVAALDLTFSAPKSVSVLFAVADESTSRALRDAHERAVNAALSYLEREACFTRRGRGGTDRLRGGGFVAASYRHRMSRAGDPQLHTHVVVANMARAQRRYTALDAHSLYEHKSVAGALYRAVLRAEVRERLEWVSWRTAGRGLFEVDGIPEGVLRHFSQRRVEIEERAVELVGAGGGGLSRERMQGIALQTRRAKQYGVDGATWREQARARAAEHGFGQRELADLEARTTTPEASPDLYAVYARLSGPRGLTEKHNGFARRHALAEIAGAFAQGISASGLEEVASAYLDSPEVIPTGDAQEPRYTTAGLLACERLIVESAQRRARGRTAVIAPLLVERVLGAHEPALNVEQAAAVRAIAGSSRGVDAVQALAGTGKTTMLAALAACYRQARYRVIGSAPTARAARQLREAAGIPAATMHSLLAELERAGGFGSRTVLLLDEAGMAPTRVTAELFAHAERAGVKVIPVGDPGQLTSVQAGGWLAALSRRQPGPALREVIRQRDPQERRALEALHDGEPGAYLAHKQEALTVHATETDALSALVEQWHTAQRHYGPERAVMIVRDNHTREQLNRAAREQLKRDGALPLHGIQIGRREYATGDRVIARRNDRHHDVDNGTLGTVTDIDSHRMLLETGASELRELDLGYVAAHVEHAYALTGHGAQSSTVSWAGVIGRPEEFTREWAYTALSRAREQTVLHIIAEPSDREHRARYAPAQPDRDIAATLQALQRAMRRSDAEPLALEQIRPGGELDHRLTQAHAARQTALERLAELDLQRTLARPSPPPRRAPPTRWRQLHGPERGIHLGR